MSTATIIAYDVSTKREIIYRFVRSDGSVSPRGRLAFAGDGAVAQSVTDRWAPHGSSPWTALEIVAPQHVRSRHLAIPAICARRIVAETTR